MYNVYDINQLTTDDLRVLKATAFLTPNKVKIGSKYNLPTSNNGRLTKTTESGGNITVELALDAPAAATSYLSKQHSSIQSLHGATYEVEMPLDYLHMLNCVCIYYVAKTKDCWDAGSYIEVPATRLTADSWSQIVTDIYNRPSPMKPYYYIHNLNTANTLPTNAVNITDGKKFSGIDMPGEYKVTSYDLTGVATAKEAGSNFKRTFKLDGITDEVSVVEKPIASRIGNASTVRCEIRYGKDDTLFQLAEVLVDYVKVPQHIRLTQEQIDLTEDTSQIMEFPDYVNQEIINELVHLVMARTNDPLLGNHILMSQSIARPTGQLQQPQAQA